MEVTVAPSIVHCRRNLEKSKVTSSVETRGLPWCVLWALGWAAACGCSWVSTCASSMGVTELRLLWGNPQLAHGHQCPKITEVLMLVRFSFVL